MAEEVQTQTYDIRKTRDFRPKTVLAWKGNNVGGWQICNDPKQTGGKPGRIMPVIVKAPIDPQFRSVLTLPPKQGARVAGEDGEPTFGDMDRTLTIWEAKGYKSAKEASRATPDPEIVHFLIERYVKEQRADMEARRYDPEVIDEKAEKLRAYLYEVNEAEPPKYDPIEAEAERYGLKAEELMAPAREEAEKRNQKGKKS